VSNFREESSACRGKDILPLDPDIFWETESSRSKLGIKKSGSLLDHLYKHQIRKSHGKGKGKDKTRRYR